MWKGLAGISWMWKRVSQVSKGTVLSYILVRSSIQVPIIMLAEAHTKDSLYSLCVIVFCFRNNSFPTHFLPRPLACKPTATNCS